MKATRIALALAALGMGAAHAGSLPGLTAAGIPASNQIFVSGSSSLSASFAAVVSSLCDIANGGVVTTYSCGSSGVAVSCTRGKPDSGFFRAAFAVSKRDTDGSFAGVGNVIDRTPITGWCDNDVVKTGINGVVNTVTAIAPDAGLTDVDTNVWVGMSRTGALSLPAPPATGMSLNGGFAGQGFGVMASEGLYRAMQVKQVNDGRLPASCSTVTPATVAGVTAAEAAFTPGACQPTIRKQEYAAIVADGNLSYVFPVSVTDRIPTFVSPLTGTLDPIHICRRVETSGAQAASNVYFLNNPCGNANPTFGAKMPRKVDLLSGTAVVLTKAANGVDGNFDDFGGGAGFFTVFEGSGTGDTRNCLSRRSRGNNPANVADGMGTYAIGVISLENLPATGRRFLKLDGVSPNAYQVLVGSADDIAGGGAADGWAQDTTQRITTVRGQYDFAPELDMLWPTSTTFGTTLRKIKDGFADPAAINLTAIFQTNGVFTHDAFPKKVHKGTRNGNFCAPQSLFE